VRTKEDLPSYILLSVFSSIANEVWNYTKLLRLGVRPRITFCGLAVHYKPIFTLFASTIAMSIYVMLDSLMLGLLSNYDEVAYYSVSMHLVKTFVSIATSLAAVAIPRMSQYNFEGEYDKMNLLVEKSLGIVSLMAFPFCIGIMLIAPVFAPLFFGESFMGAIGPMQIGALVIVAIGYSNLNGLQILVALGQDRPFFVSVLSGAIFNFMMNFILIPSYGAIGATISSVMAETLICIVTEYYVRKYTKVKISNYSNVIKSICGALLFIPMSNVCYKLFTGWTFIIIMVFSCAFIYCVFQLLTKNSIFQEFFQSMVHKHRGYAKIG
jgi:O-antigen/teichoic acid export membrane protein